MIWVNIFMGYQLKKDPDLPQPESIVIKDREYLLKDIVPTIGRVAGPQQGTTQHFRLLPPYTQWPPQLTKLSAPTLVASRILRGEYYPFSLIFSPTATTRTLVTTVPFVAIKQHWSKRLTAYWQFYFRTEVEMQLCLTESPAGQWVAAGHRITGLRRLERPQDDKNNLLHTYRSRGQDRLQRNKRGRSQLVDPVPVSHNGENGHAVELEQRRPKMS
jgi:hypothetical protein